MRTKRLIPGLLSIVVLASLLFFVAANLLWVVARCFSPSDDFFSFLVAIPIIDFVITVPLAILFVRDALSSPLLPQSARAAWVSLLFSLSAFVFPYYWYRYYRQRPEQPTSHPPE